MSEVVLSLARTQDGRPVNPGDLIVLHVDRKDVACPSGWTQNAAMGASGMFFWCIATSHEATAIRLWSPSPESFVVDAMALYPRPAPGDG